MAATKTKIKTVLLILMLAGSEAARLSSMLDITKATRDFEEAIKKGVPADKQWQQVNRAHCSWRIWKGGCRGKGCSYRPLPLDQTLTDSCRLSNDYMLHGNGSQPFFTSLQAAILTEQAEKFKDHCFKNVSVIEIFAKPTLRCLHRASHMLHATEFMMKYQRELLSNENAFLGKGQQEKQQQSVEKALETLADALGEDGHHILMFRKKLISKPLAIMKNSAESVREIANVMYGLMSGNSTTKNQAQEFVKQMPTGKGHLNQEDVETLKEAFEKAPKDPNVTDDKIFKTWRVMEAALLGNSQQASNAREVIEKEAASADGPTALLQVNQTQALSKINLQRVVVAILWLLFIASLIGTILIGAEVLTNLPESALWVVMGTFWYSGIALGMQAIWSRLGSGSYGYKSTGPTQYSEDESRRRRRES